MTQPGADTSALQQEIARKRAHLRNLETQESDRNLRVPALEPFLKTWREIRELYLRQEVQYAARNNNHVSYMPEEAVELLLTYLSDQEQFESKLQEQLDTEVTHRRATLYHRLTPLVGDITDMKGMLISADSSINGLVKGASGKAFVQTIWSGGEVSQRRHTHLRIKQL